MPTTTARESPPSVADLLERIEELGGIDPRRVVLEPLPGTATEADLLRLSHKSDRIYELVDGTLVEKVMGYPESTLATWIIRLLGAYLDINDIGELGGADGTLRLDDDQIRAPDVSFVRHEKRNAGNQIRRAVPRWAPDLAVEVLSPSNTPAEMARKLRDYFGAGTLLVWIVDPERRTVTVHTSATDCHTLTEADTLDGGEVLPGFTLAVRRIFERMPAPEPEPAVKRSRKKKSSG